MTCPNEFLEFYIKYRADHIYNLRWARKKLFHLIGKTKTISIWRKQPVGHLIIAKPFAIPEEETFL